MDLEKGCVKLPKVGLVRAKLHREFEGKIKTSTVKLHPSGKYTVSILVEDGLNLPDTTIVEEGLTVGVDLGIKDFAICSDGKKFYLTIKATSKSSKIT